MRGCAEPAHEPGHQGKADGKQNQRAAQIIGTQEMLTAKAQGDGGGEPNQQSGA